MRELAEIKKKNYLHKVRFEEFRHKDPDIRSKLIFCFYLLGINARNSAYKGYGRSWGDCNRPIDVRHPANKYFTDYERHNAPNLVVIHK